MMDPVANPDTPNPTGAVDEIADLLEKKTNLEDKPNKTNECMAKLHALLTKEHSKVIQRAESRALAQTQYYHRATQFFSQAQNNNSDAFPFFALPAELRLEVYSELLVTDDRLVVTWRGPRKVNKQQRRMHINILRSCKQCHDEGVSVLYGENVFDFEEICNRPLSVAKPFLDRIGARNASLIRIIIAEYSAAVEELSQLKENRSQQLTKSLIKDIFSPFNIDVNQLRVLAISIIPYGFDQATQDLMRQQAPLIMNTMALRVNWLDVRNDIGRLGQVVQGICEREPGLVRADFWKDVDNWISFHWSPPFGGREWVVFKT